MFRNILLICGVICILLSGSPANSQEIAPTIDPSLKKEAIHAINKAVNWLEANQQENGCWSIPVFPAITGLVVVGILNSPEYINSTEVPPSVEKGLNFILSYSQENGSIYNPAPESKGGGLPNYNTALSLMAIAEVGKPEYNETIKKAREYLIQSQYLGGGEYNGGMGYDASNDRNYADLSNTAFALEALRRTEKINKDIPEEKSSELDWQAAISFVSRCQHMKEFNQSSWVSDASSERGGFIYTPKRSQAGSVMSGDEETNYLRSYGSMTYAGLLSFLYAKMDKEDIRVKGAIDWISKKWTVEENPGMGNQGLYYNYHTMAKALNLFGQDYLETSKGKTVKWREELIRKLISIQKIDPETGYGYWQNESNRWMENDPNLSTAYALIALEVAVFGKSPSI